jgi:hypothetical protein
MTLYKGEGEGEAAYDILDGVAGDDYLNGSAANDASYGNLFERRAA